MFPYIVVFGKIITSYTILAMVGIFVVGYFGIKKAKKYNVNDDEIIIFLLVVACGVFLGGHLLYGIVNFPFLLTWIYKGIPSFSILLTILYQTFGGSIFYGGLFGGLLFAVIYSKKRKMNGKQYLNLLTPAIPLFHFFGRLGCFLSGCCFGIESKVGWMYQNALIASANGVRRFPVQLVEALCNFMLFLFLYQLQKKPKYASNLLYFYFIIYALIRFFLEFLRGDSYRGFVFGFSTSQVISLAILIWSIGYWGIKKFHN